MTKQKGNSPGVIKSIMNWKKMKIFKTSKEKERSKEHKRNNQIDSIVNGHKSITRTHSAGRDHFVSTLPSLPEDVISFIFAYLDPQTLLMGVSRACKKWNEIVSSGRIYNLHPWIYRANIQVNTKFRQEGRAHFDKKMWKESITSFTRAIILNPRDHLSYFWRAYAFDESGKYDLAVKDFSKSLEFEPADATAYSNRGATYRDMGSPEKALRDLRKALEMDPNSAPVHNNIGVVLGDMGLYEEALKEYTMALDIDPNHVVALRNRGRRLEKLGRIQEAEDDFSKVLLLNSKDAVALRFFENRTSPLKSPLIITSC